MTLFADHQDTRDLEYSDLAARDIENLVLGTPANPQDTMNPWEGALCAQTDPEAFFPETGESAAEGKRICEGCPLREACLEYALENGEEFGVWGGLSATERKRLTRQSAQDYMTRRKVA